MRYRYNRFCHNGTSRIVLFLLFIIGISSQSNSQKQDSGFVGNPIPEINDLMIRKRISAILTANLTFYNGTTDIDPFFGQLLCSFAQPSKDSDFQGKTVQNATAEFGKVGILEESKLEKSNLVHGMEQKVKKEISFDWGDQFKLEKQALQISELDNKYSDLDTENQVLKLFSSFFNIIRNKGIDKKVRNVMAPMFKEIVIPNLMEAVFNSELEGPTRAILTNELLLDAEIGRASIPETRPDGLPSILFIGIESNMMPFNVVYQKERDGFLFRTFQDVDLPEIPKIAGERLKEWVVLKYKEIYDSIVRKLPSNEENYSIIELIDKYGLFFVVEFKDDAVCFLSKVTLFNSISDLNTTIESGYYSRVTRLLFARLRPFIPLASSFIPLEITEFRSLSFVGSPILMSRADSEEDILTQQVLYYWSHESEKVLSDYERKRHLCNERELYKTLEYGNLCLIPPRYIDPRNPETINNGYLVTVSCFGLQPIGTIALYSHNSQYLLKTCEEDGKWGNARILTNSERATVILHKCHSRNNSKTNFFSLVSTINKN
ncbi:hypothetical protein FG386_003629 [Cryptosporidium ryanae]|uniref:uncharacterized protein n=1 Tax=Cryptosporidium ryanae TaxID=515981 RepID=UPI00351A1AD9|nr:hypothetical protein FG386_003629 [Cryptosporidium ryanae]